MVLPIESKNEMVLKEGKLGEDAESATNQQKGKASNMEAAIHLFKGSVGAGLFAMGDAFKNGGMLGASILLPIIAVVTVHCERMLIEGSIMAVERTSGATFFDYPETVEKCFQYGPKPFRGLSKLMKLIVEMFLCVTQFGFCAIYFVFISENVIQVLHENGVNMSLNVVMLCTLLPAMIPSLLTSLKYITPLNLLANFAILFGLFATLAIAFGEGPMPPLSERKLITNGSQLSLFFGTALFSYEGIALILPLRNSMRTPEKFSTRFGVLNVSLTIITILFMFTGIVSYLRWGEEVEGSITLNIEVESIFGQVVKVSAAIGVFFGYPIQFFIMIQIIWVPMRESWSCVKKHALILEVLLRFFMVLLTFGVALVVPQLGLFISLIGALCSTSLALIVPVLINFVVLAQKPKGLTTWIYIKNILILAVAAVGIVTGTYESIVNLVKAFET